MHENHQLDIAKKAITVIINQLAGPWDNIGLIAFDAGVEVVFRWVDSGGGGGGGSTVDTLTMKGWWSLRWQVVVDNSTIVVMKVVVVVIVPVMVRRIAMSICILMI